MLDSAVQWTNHYPADFLACLDSRRDCCAQGYLFGEARTAKHRGIFASREGTNLHEAPAPKKLQHAPANTASYEGYRFFRDFPGE